MNTNMKVYNAGKGQIDLSKPMQLPAKEMRPTELHYKEDGAIDDSPSFVILMETNGFAISARTVYGQFSLATLTDCLNQLGYDIVEKKIVCPDCGDLGIIQDERGANSTCPCHY